MGLPDAAPLDLVAERWTLRLIQELLFGPRRFTDLRRDTQGISANLLTDRLRTLEIASVVARRRLPPPYNAVVYELTSWGERARPVLVALAQWARSAPIAQQESRLTARGLLVQLFASFDPTAAHDLDATLRLTLNGETFDLAIRHGSLLTCDPPAKPDLCLEGDVASVAVAIASHPMLEQLVSDGLVQASGRSDLVRQLSALFPAIDLASAHDPDHSPAMRQPRSAIAMPS